MRDSVTVIGAGLMGSGITTGLKKTWMLSPN